MIDTDKLRKAVKSFVFYSRPSNADRSAPCTISDLNKIVEDVSKLLNVFIDEIEADRSDRG